MRREAGRHGVLTARRGRSGRSGRGGRSGRSGPGAAAGPRGGGRAPAGPRAAAAICTHKRLPHPRPGTPHISYPLHRLYSNTSRAVLTSVAPIP